MVRCAQQRATEYQGQPLGKHLLAACAIVDVVIVTGPVLWQAIDKKLEGSTNESSLESLSIRLR